VLRMPSTACPEHWTAAKGLAVKKSSLLSRDRGCSISYYYLGK
jgi:hypothetical protein